jgi:mannose-1-phosphate guanylyltransferase/mannose-6-phosphate isomerase
MRRPRALHAGNDYFEIAFMTSIDLQPVIIAGGSGTRLWPLSRSTYPKQFLALHGRHSLFQQAALRLHSLAAADIAIGGLCVVGIEDHRFLVLDQLVGLKLPPATLLLEPAGRNTAPAMTLAALAGTQQGRDPVLVVTPADQSIGDEAAFTAVLQRAVRAAAAGAFVILGVAPDRPETGYG